MKTIRLVHQPDSAEGAPGFTLAITYADDSTATWTIAPAQALDVTFAAASVVVTPTGVLAPVETTLSIEGNLTAYLLHPSLQVYRQDLELAAGPYIVAAFFWAWLSYKLCS